MRLRVPLPQDPPRRALAVAIVCSVLLHLLLLAAVFLGVPFFGTPMYIKRGEPLFVDIAPDKPEEKAPLGNPARPPGPDAKEPAPPKPAVPPAPKPAEAPKSPPRAPEPPRQIAKSEPRPAPPAARATEPEPAAPAPQPAAPAKPEAAQSADPGSQPSAPSQPSNPQVATARPPSIFRPPAGGGGLQGGRGGRAGEPVPLDTPDPNYKEYMEKVKQRIYTNWGYPADAIQRGLQGQLTVEFHIAKDGVLEFIALRESSGQEVLDRYALNAVKLAQRYPPLPDAMKRDVLPIVAVFVYTLGDPRSVLQMLR